MSKIAPKETRAILVAAGLIRADSILGCISRPRKYGKTESMKAAIEERKRMFKQAPDSSKK